MAVVRRRALSALIATVSLVLAGLTGLVVAPAAHASAPDIQITEVAYGGKSSVEGSKGGDGEYVELTNVGDAAQDLTGWKYFVDTADATDTTPTSEPTSGGIDLSSFGTVQPGESVIVTDLTPADFRTEWGLKAGVKVVQDNNWNPANPTVVPTVKVSLDSGPDNINIFDGSGAVADHAWYKSKGIGYGGSNQKGVAIYAASTGDLALTDISTWAGASNATTTSDPDAWTSASGAIGSPGISTLGTAQNSIYTPAAVRETNSGGSDIQITELAYGGKSSAETSNGGKGGDGEYVELTNVGYVAQDMTSWYEDVNQNGTDEGHLDLSGLGTLQPGESGIITDLTPADFRTEWSLKSSVKIIQDNNWNPATPTVSPTMKVTLDSGPDTISIYNNAPTPALVDQVSYANKYFAINGTNTKGLAAYVDYGQLASTSTAAGWTTPATVGDIEGSWASASGAIGSPGASTQGSVTPAAAKNAGVTISGAVNQTAGVGIAFTSATPTASGGTAPYTWSATGLGSFSLDPSSGVITGTPSAAGVTSVTLTATDSLSNSSSVMFTITTVAVDPNWPDIVINEITSDNADNPQLTSHLAPALNAALGTGAKDLVELYNKGAQAVDITGWKQIDSGAAASATVFSSRVYDVNGNLITSIPAHGYGVFSSGAGLGSGGDAVKIYLPTGTLVDSVTYGAGQAGYDESLDPGSVGPSDTTEIYHALARCGDGAGSVNTNSNDTTTSWYSVKVASFGTSNASSCDTSTDAAAAVQYYNEQPPTGLPSTCAPSAPSGSDSIAVPDAVTWPTGDGVTNVDNTCEFITAQDPTGNDMSSLVFSSDGSVLWGAQNKNHIWKLVKDSGTGKYLPATDNNWSSGKGITFTGTDPAVSQPDDEGLTVGGNGDLFVTSERDNANNNTSKDEVLEYDPTATGTTLAPVKQWDLTSEFVPSVIAATGDDANLGFEGVTYVPDSFLTAHGFHDQHLNKTYTPADYPLHGAGLFFLGFEKNGHVYAYALNSDGTFQRVADIDTGIDGTSAIADLQFNADDQGIWLDCDNDCGVVDSLMRIDTSGNFTRVASYKRPAGLPDDNLEGFAIAPASTATNGKRQVVWSDDGIYGEGNAWNSDHTNNAPSADWGHALYSTTLPVDAAPTGITGTVTATGVFGAAYSSAALSATGAFPNVITYSVSGSLPSGLSLNPATGAITGTPTATGTFNFTIAASNGNGTATKSATITVGLATLANTPTPTIGGSGAVGTTLTANVGTWDSGVTTGIQWLDGSTVLGSGTTLTVAMGEVGHTITLSVTGSKTGYTSVTKTATIVAIKGTLTKVTPKIKGTAKVGDTLTVTVGTWGPGHVTTAIQWYANGKAIAKATHTTLVLAPADSGKQITVIVTGSETGYNTTTAKSAATAKVKNGSFSFKGSVKISGTVRFGRTLSAKPGTFKAPGASKITIKYQWYANGKAIKGATHSTLKLGAAERGKKLTVTVTASATGFSNLAKGSGKTKAVAS